MVVQQLPMLVNSVCALEDALVTQLFWQVVSAQALMQAMIPLQVESLTHVWVTVQQLVLTQLAQLAELKVTPQAVVPPTEPLLLPLPLLPLEPPLDPLLEEHALAQLAVTQLETPWSAFEHAVFEVTLAWHVCDCSAVAL